MDQLAFFDDLPKGLRYEPEFVSHHDESRLLGEIRRIELKPFEFGQFRCQYPYFTCAFRA